MSQVFARKKRGQSPPPTPKVSEWTREKCMEVMREHISAGFGSVKFSPEELEIAAGFEADTLDDDIKALSNEVKDALIHEFVSILRNDGHISEINGDSIFKSTSLYIDPSDRYDEPDWSGYSEMLDTLGWERLRELTTQTVCGKYSKTIDADNIWLQGADDATSNILSSAELRERLPPLNGKPITDYMFSDIPRLDQQWKEATRVDDYVQTLAREDLLWIVKHMFTTYRLDIESSYTFVECESMNSARESIFKSMTREELNTLAHTLGMVDSGTEDDDDLRCKIEESARNRRPETPWWARYNALPFNASQEAAATQERERLVEKRLTDMPDDALRTRVREVCYFSLRHLRVEDDPILQRYKLHLVYFPTDTYKTSVREKLLASMTRSELIIAWTQMLRKTHGMCLIDGLHPRGYDVTLACHLCATTYHLSEGLPNLTTYLYEKPWNYIIFIAGSNDLGREFCTLINDRFNEELSAHFDETTTICEFLNEDMDTSYLADDAIHLNSHGKREFSIALENSLRECRKFSAQ